MKSQTSPSVGLASRTSFTAAGWPAQVPWNTSPKPPRPARSRRSNSISQGSTCHEGRTIRPPKFCCTEGAAGVLSCLRPPAPTRPAPAPTRAVSSGGCSLRRYSLALPEPSVYKAPGSNMTSKTKGSPSMIRMFQHPPSSSRCSEQGATCSKSARSLKSSARCRSRPAPGCRPLEPPGAARSCMRSPSFTAPVAGSERSRVSRSRRVWRFEAWCPERPKASDTNSAATMTRVTTSLPRKSFLEIFSIHSAR
mmetsp:Transcript_148157/g.475863  ORF Transcript_148157/g.475863 Transcript_148157/m.475863 type:complete len:251 (-) Transcript_148157:527-1279(-)